MALTKAGKHNCKFRVSELPDELVPHLYEVEHEIVRVAYTVAAYALSRASTLVRFLALTVGETGTELAAKVENADLAGSTVTPLRRGRDGGDLAAVCWVGGGVGLAWAGGVVAEEAVPSPSPNWITMATRGTPLIVGHVGLNETGSTSFFTDDVHALASGPMSTMRPTRCAP